MPVALKYWLIQLPGAICIALALYLVHRQGWIAPGWLAVLFALWVAKDAVLYPLTRDAYRSDNARAGHLPGSVGIVHRRLAPRGTVRLDGALWQARLASPEEPPVEVGTAIRVREIRGLVLIVEPEPGAPS